MNKIGILLLFCIQISCSSQEKSKINGVSFVSSRIEVAQEHIQEVVDLNANHAAVMPFGFIRDLSSPEVKFNTDKQWFGETKSGAKQYIEMLHKNKIEVMLKPQIWIWRGEFTGNLKMNSEEEWQTLEQSYSDFILTYAQLAQEANVEILCIGTELEQFVVNRPNYWSKLILEIKEVYKGKLTYAANWDEYAKVPFWKALDYIGVDAYFPLSEEKLPSVAALRKGWKKWKPAMKELSIAVDRPILFTEYGYRSMDYTAKKPWLVDRNDENVNLEAQVNATEAIIQEFWSEDWFAGGYVWKWFIDHKQSGGGNDNRFTPQNKPAEETLRQLYKVNNRF
ncbi:glycoside hydrolase [Cellulophaga sp. E16_2]|uniref:glycoside hydrolase family 113 n=1 Tax=unclassified Cellulophaga TaxID=2634405 RepID=UPI0013FDA1DD|nr:MULTISPECIES: glycoside hydrolase [unclassified Cellulophaga]MBO0590692.1 glycoside hydrolase [Cellulophaga sp. E16_2]